MYCVLSLGFDMLLWALDKAHISSTGQQHRQNIMNKKNQKTKPNKTKPLLNCHTWHLIKKQI